MKKKIILGILSAIILLFIGVFVLFASILHYFGVWSIARMQWEHKNTPIMLAQVNDFYKHYNKKDFDYIYDNLIYHNPKYRGKKRYTRQKFKADIVPFYKKMGKFEGFVNSNPFEDWYFLMLKYQIKESIGYLSNKPYPLTNFYNLKALSANIPSDYAFSMPRLDFRAKYQNGEASESYTFMYKNKKFKTALFPTSRNLLKSCTEYSCKMYKKTGTKSKNRSHLSGILAKINQSKNFGKI